MTILAEVAIGGALVYVTTIVGHTYLLISFWADAHEGANQVLTSKFAAVGRSDTLVDV